jgi:hypothetical protein
MSASGGAPADKPKRPPEQVSLRPRIDRLGVKRGFRVAIVGVEDPDLLHELRTRTDEILLFRPRDKRDVIFYAAESLNALEELADLKAHIVDSGAVWVVSKKGRERSLTDTDVIAAAKRAGLVENKAVSFSPTHTALRLVIPVALRQC